MITVFWDVTLVIWQTGTKVSEKNSAPIFREKSQTEKFKQLGSEVKYF